MKKLLFSLTAICLLAISCDQNSASPELDRVDLLTDKAIESIEFQNLGISSSSLNLDHSQYVNSEENSLFIPFKGMDDRKGVIALFTNEDQLRTVADYEVKTQIASENIFDKLQEGTFDGEFYFANQDVEVIIRLEKSKIISRKSTHRNTFARTEECNNITEPGGAADCAGARLEDMNWLDAGMCYVRFVPCMAQLTISCWLDDCKV